jgi:hypothetical protein
MIDNFIDVEFHRLCQQAEEIDRGTLNAPDMEPTFIELLTLVHNHPNHREQFVQLFLDVAQWRIQAPPFLIEFCMRELRYPEVLASLEQEFHIGYQAPGFARRFNFIHGVLDVYNETWRDEDMWPYFTNKQNRDSS